MRLSSRRRAGVEDASRRLLQYGLLSAVTLLGALPYGEELWRCVRAARTIDPEGRT